MRITGLPPVGPARGRPPRAGEARFAPDQAATRSAGAGPAQPVTSVDMLVALAAVDDGAERRRRHAAEAERGLDALEALDAELAAGGASEARLEEIATWAAGLSTPDDPALARLQKEIELRALVELAKHRR